MANTTIVQVGTLQRGHYYANFTTVLDVNDRVTYFVRQQGIKIDQPEKIYVRGFNLEVPGETVSKFQYKNRHVQLSLNIRASNAANVILAVRKLIQAIETPGYWLNIQPPGSTAQNFAQVVSVKHKIPLEALQMLAGTLLQIEVDLEIGPFFYGPPQVLDNLVTNPGFEAPSGPGVTVFNDAFANANAYSATGGTPTVAANVMTIPNGCIATFGSPNWGPFNLWQVRFQFQTGANINFSFHGGTASDVLYVSLIITTMSLIHTVAGVAHTLSSQAITLTNGTWYWLQMRHIYQSGLAAYPPILQVTLLNDSAGALGTVIANIGLGPTPVTAWDTITALQGRPNISVSGAAVLIGGAFSNVNMVQLFGPGGWLTEVNNSGTTPASLAWDATTTYPNGPATSNYAARIDAPPSGTWGADFNTAYVGGATGSPVAIGSNQVAHALFWCKSNGLSGAAVITLLINEYDGNATYLRTTTTTLTGNQATWTKLQLDWTTGSNTTFAAMQCRVSDTSAPGASANATVWYDNVQCWNDTFGSTMPYCELRFPMAPAQLLVSGLIGDVPAPAFFAIGLNVASWAASGSINLWMGRRAQVGNAIFVKPPQAATLPVAIDSTSYGGFYINFSGIYYAAPTGLSLDSANGAGFYHVFARGQTANGAPTTIQLRASSIVGQAPFGFGAQAVAVGPYILGLFSATGVWTTLDVGQIAIPGVQLGVFDAASSTFNAPQPQITGSGSDFSKGGYSALLPVDAEVFVATLLNPSGGSTQTNRWIYAYWDGIANGVLVSNENNATPNWMTPLGTTGSGTGAFIAINPVGDLVARVDPTLVNTVGATPNVGVNQFVVIANDQNNLLLPVAVSLAYQPAFLWPR